MAEDHTQKLTDAIVRRVQKKLGDDAAGFLDVVTLYSRVKEYVSTQCFALDFAMHLPGLPAGRVTTIVGTEGSGKTTLACHVLAETQRRGGVAVLIDTEYAFDEERAARIGIDPTSLIVCQPETIEEATTEIEEMIEQVAETREETGIDKLVTIVWDSVAGLPTKAELEGDPGDVRPGAHAKALSGVMRRLTKKLAKERVILLFVNQEKERMDFGPLKLGGGKTMIAEHPLGFHSSMILAIRQTEILRNSKKKAYAIRSRVYVKKNKKAAPFSDAEVIINFDDGIDQLGSLLAVALQLGIVTKDKGWCHHGKRKFREKDFAAVLEDEPDIMAQLEATKEGLIDKGRVAEEATLADRNEPDEEPDEEAPVARKKPRRARRRA